MLKDFVDAGYKLDLVPIMIKLYSFVPFPVRFELMRLSKLNFHLSIILEGK
jgi:hypothetical protein